VLTGETPKISGKSRSRIAPESLRAVPGGEREICFVKKKSIMKRPERAGGEKRGQHF